MSKILYIEACAGASGDMLAGALLDLGWPLDHLRGLISDMGLTEVAVEHVRQMQGPLAGGRLDVVAPPEQPHRHLHHIVEHLERLPRAMAQRAKAVFQRLAEAEAAVHGTTPDHVHFHEVGAIDAMVDVVAFCAGLEWLGVGKVVASPLPLGRGWIDCAHGRIPLPAPAVVRLLAGAPVIDWPEEGETVTPTGAALIMASAQSFGPAPAMRLERVGTGCGSRPGGLAPNVLRLWLGEEEGQALDAPEVVEISCHLDDLPPEDLPLVLERLLAAGALDAAAAPLYMKKGRPGLLLMVVARPAQAESLAQVMLAETSSLGVRLKPGLHRHMLPREVVELETGLGPVKFKRARLPQGWRLKPEADEVHRLAREKGLSAGQVRALLPSLVDDQED